jgi:Cys-rich repeat protein
MIRSASLRLATMCLLGLGLSGFGPGSCGPETNPCEGLDEATCGATAGCEPLYAATLCACAPCAEGETCTCGCPAPGYAGCSEQVVKPEPPTPICEGLDESGCIAMPGCAPTYFDDPGCGHGSYAGCVAYAEPPNPATCEALGESECLKRSDCEPVYASCGGFGGCATRVCPAVACMLYCPNGFAKDAKGCDICSCQGSTCFSDADCAAGQVCSLPTVPPCPEGAMCPDYAGVCVPAQTGCRADSDCPAGEVCRLPDCGPNADCAGTGYCAPATRTCSSNADCAATEICQLAYGTCPAGASGCVGSGICAEVPCGEGMLCPTGSVCRADPTDPCNGPTIDCYAPGRQLCLSPCAELDEQACSARLDCRGVWGSACDEAGNCTPDRAFRCEDATGACPDVVCELWCPNGYELDSNGCQTCSCKPGCTADSECPAGERCEALVTECDSSGSCWTTGGTCVPAEAGCVSDADCASGETCQFEYEACPPGAAGCANRGVCVPAVASCRSDADCAAGQVCELPLVNCSPEMNCPNPVGTCRDLDCSADSDCPAGTLCRADPKDPCSQPGTMCFAPVRQICQAPCAGLDEAGCLARADCSTTYGPASDGQMAFLSCGTR